MSAERERYDMDLRNMRGLLYSTVSAFTKAIDERTPYNANHTKHVAKYVTDMVSFLDRKYRMGGKAPYFTFEEGEQIIMAAHLHDVGKLVVPLEVMNKANRMGRDGLERIHGRFLLLKAYLKIDYLEGRIGADVWRAQEAGLEELEERIRKADRQTVLRKKEIRYFTEMGKRTYRQEDGTEIPWLTGEEIKNLQIQKGTLNEDERETMEYHAVATGKILQEIRFGKQYDKVLEITGTHHEFLDGSGYPAGLRGEEISRGTRLLTIADIYDSLIATDRPYKRPIKKEKAKQILRDMAESGKLDGELVELFCEYLGQPVRK